jgi:hypothetical protein
VNRDFIKGNWYAQNSEGYHLLFSNKVFFDGTQPISSVPGMRFSTKQLIAHELAHTINWRARLQNSKGIPKRAGEIYVDEMMKEGNLKKDDGMTFAARSDNKAHYEIVTDAVAHYNLDNFIDDEKGQKRKSQIEDLLTRCLKHRFSLDEVAFKNSISKWKLTEVEDCFPLLDFDAFEAIRLGQEPMNKDVPITYTSVVARPEFKADAANFVQSVRDEFSDLQFNDKGFGVHVTLMFKMREGLTVEQWDAHMANVLSTYEPFFMAFRCAITMPDLTDSKDQRYHVFLVPDEGFSNVVKLHNSLYTGELVAKLVHDVPYIPHILLGYHDEAAYCNQVVDFVNKKGTIVGKVSTVKLFQDSGEGMQEIKTYTLTSD